MKKILLKLLIGVFCLFPSIFISWLMWFPVRLWAFQQIPADMAWMKIIVVILIGCFGGITIPIALFVCGLILALKVMTL